MNHPSTTRRGLAGWVGAVLGLVGGNALAAEAPGASAGPSGGATPGSAPAEDRMAIIELMARYAWAYDTDDAAALASTFTPDGVLEVFGNAMVSRPAEHIPAFIAQAKSMKGEHGWQHLTDHHLFRDYDGQRCTVYSYYIMPEGDRSGGNVSLRAMGYYVSHCVRTAQGWRFAKRAVVRWNGKSPTAI